MKAVQGSGDGPIDVEVERNANERSSDSRPSVKPTKRPYYTLGILTIENTKLVRAESVGEAIRLGVRESLKFIKQIVYILKKIALGDVPAKEHLGGPISIVTQTYQVAQTGFSAAAPFPWDAVAESRVGESLADPRARRWQPLLRDRRGGEGLPRERPGARRLADGWCVPIGGIDGLGHVPRHPPELRSLL